MSATPATMGFGFGLKVRVPRAFPTPIANSDDMASTSQKTKGRGDAVSTLDVLIQSLSLAEDTCGIPPAQIALGAAIVLLTMIGVCFFILFTDQLPAHGA